MAAPQPDLRPRDDEHIKDLTELISIQLPAVAACTVEIPPKLYTPYATRGNYNKLVCANTFSTHVVLRRRLYSFHHFRDFYLAR